jgi:hypothetical protein
MAVPKNRSMQPSESIKDPRAPLAIFDIRAAAATHSKKCVRGLPSNSGSAFCHAM